MKTILNNQADITSAFNSNAKAVEYLDKFSYSLLKTSNNVFTINETVLHDKTIPETSLKIDSNCIVVYDGEVVKTTTTRDKSDNDKLLYTITIADGKMLIKDDRNPFDFFVANYQQTGESQDLSKIWEEIENIKKQETSVDYLFDLEKIKQLKSNKKMITVVDKQVSGSSITITLNDYARMNLKKQYSITVPSSYKGYAFYSILNDRLALFEEDVSDFNTLIKVANINGSIELVDGVINDSFNEVLSSVVFNLNLSNNLSTTANYLNFRYINLKYFKLLSMQVNLRNDNITKYYKEAGEHTLSNKENATEDDFLFSIKCKPVKSSISTSMNIFHIEINFDRLCGLLSKQATTDIYEVNKYKYETSGAEIAYIKNSAKIGFGSALNLYSEQNVGRYFNENSGQLSLYVGAGNIEMNLINLKEKILSTFDKFIEFNKFPFCNINGYTNSTIAIYKTLNTSTSNLSIQMNYGDEVFVLYNISNGTLSASKTDTSTDVLIKIYKLRYEQTLNIIEDYRND